MPGYDPAPDEEMRIDLVVASAGYFESLSFPILEGRGINEADVPGNAEVVVINRSMATRYWPDVSPLGRTIDLSGFPTPGDELLGFDIVQRYADAVVDTRDGWGMYQGITFRYSNPLDGDSFADDVFLVNLTIGAPQGLFWYYSSGRSNIFSNTICIRNILCT